MVAQTGEPSDLAFTLCARLCHDLAGAAGALSGSLEMAAGSADADALSLALDCARELTAKLRLLRLAWGTVGESPPIADLVAGLPGVDRLRVDVAGMGELADAPRRLVANLLLLAAQSLPRGGAIRLSGHAAAMSLAIEGPRAAWPQALGNDGAAVEAREVVIAVIRLLADDLGMKLIIQDQTHLSVRASSPA